MNSSRSSALAQWSLPAIVLVASAALVLADPKAAGELAGRLLPVLAFVAALSVVVNTANELGVFHTVAASIGNLLPRGPRGQAMRLGQILAWGSIIALSTVTTVFLSLDTTALLITPLAVILARQERLPMVPTALAVVWIANLGSLLLPVSNLTNLLAESGGHFPMPGSYAREAFLPGALALAVAVAAAAIAFFVARSQAMACRGRRATNEETRTRDASPDFCSSGSRSSGSQSPDFRSPGARWAIGVLVALIPGLLLPIPYWIPATIAAVAMAAVCRRYQPNALSWSLIPWSSLLLTTTLSVAATLALAVGGSGVLRELFTGQVHPMLLGGLGAVCANLFNNLPAYLFLEPVATDAHDTLALLIGTNAGAIVTPWASLAVLLWHDQLRRAGAKVKWRTYIAAGAIVAPLAVAVPTLGL